MDEINKQLITSGFENYKCYDLLLSLMKNSEFNEIIKNGIELGYIKSFPQKLWEDLDKYKYFIDGLESGNNIGNCRKWAEYISYLFPFSYICSGYNQFLKNTKNSTNGEHFWMTIDGKIYDTTFMLIIDDYYMKKMGYDQRSNQFADTIPNYELSKNVLLKNNTKMK